MNQTKAGKSELTAGLEEVSLCSLLTSLRSTGYRRGSSLNKTTLIYLALDSVSIRNHRQEKSIWLRSPVWSEGGSHLSPLGARGGGRGTPAGGSSSASTPPLLLLFTWGEAREVDHQENVGDTIALKRVIFLK